MKLPLIWLSVAGLVTAAVIGCSSNPSTSSNVHEQHDIPEWFVAPPREPGKAFYGVGSATFKMGTQQNRAMKEAEAQARRQIAETLGQEIQAMIKTYAAQVVAPEGQIAEESLATDVMRAFTDRAVAGGEIVKRHISDHADANGLTHVYALAKMSFSSVAETLNNAVYDSAAIQGVRNRAEDAFAELEKRLTTVQEKAQPKAPAPAAVDGEGGEPSNTSPVANANTAPPANNAPPANTTSNRPPANNAANTTANTNRPPANTNPNAGGPQMASAASVNTWLQSRTDSRYPSYPRGNYLIGVGMAGTLEAAVNAGREQILAFFKQQIEAKLVSIAESHQSSVGGELKVNEVVKTTDTLVAITKGTIEGSQHVDTGMQNGQYVALVVLDVPAFIGKTKDKITRLGQETETKINTANNERDAGRLTLALRNLSDAMNRVREQALLLEQLQTVKAGDGVTLKYNPADIDAMILAVGNLMTVAFDVQVTNIRKNGSQAAGNVAALTERLKKEIDDRDAGITVRNSVGDAKYVVSGTITTEFLDDGAPAPMTTFITTYSLTVTETATGNTFSVANDGSSTKVTTRNGETATIGKSQEFAALQIAVAIANRFQGK